MNLLDSSLVDLASRINREHDEFEATIQRSLPHAKSAGDMLLEAKKRVKHGEWLPWLEANVHFSEWTAQAYMRVAGRWEELSSKSVTVTDLSFRGALGMLSSQEEQPVPEANGHHPEPTNPATTTARRPFADPGKTRFKSRKERQAAKASVLKQLKELWRKASQKDKEAFMTWVREESA